MSICSECHGGCCRRYYIDLTGYDIINIHQTLELDYLTFLQVLSVKEEDVEELAKDAALFKFSDDKGKKFFRFCLRRIESPVMLNSTRCMFLLEWNNEMLNLPASGKIQARCGIYGCRPLTCAIYPVKLDNSGLFGYAADPYINCDKKNNAAYNVCPRPLKDDDFTDHSGEMMKTLALRKFEMDFFKELANGWNEKPGSLKEFFEYIEKIYKNRVYKEIGRIQENK